MFGHEHERIELHLAFCARRIDSSCQSLPPIVVRQQWEAAVAGEGQLMEMTCFVNVPDSFAVKHERAILGKLKVQHWRSQWHPREGLFARKILYCRRPVVWPHD
jgi:hypothetical protein